MEKVVELKLSDVRFMAKHFSRSEVREIFEEALRVTPQASRRTFVKLQETQIEQVLLELGSLFADIGLDANDEPNSVGLQIEDYIDVFNNKLQLC